VVREDPPPNRLPGTPEHPPVSLWLHLLWFVLVLGLLFLIAVIGPLAPS
jgi:hypothetical protein